MLRLWIQSLVIASTTGLTAGVWLLFGSSITWPVQHPLSAVVGGVVVVGLAAGLVHHGWQRPAWQRWRSLHDRQDQINLRQRELECQVKLLELERQRLETIFNVLSDAVLVTGADETVQLANEAAARLLEFELPQARRQPVDQVVHDPRLLQLIREAHEAGDEGPVQRHLEHRMGCAEHTSVFDLTLAGVAEHTLSAQAAATARGGVVAILRDVTRHRCVAEMHSDFVSSVSHELRTPLSSIKAYMEMLVDGEAQDEPTRQEFYAIVQAETNRLTCLIDNLLNISRIEAGLVRVQSEVVDLRELMEEALVLVQAQARAARVTMEGPGPGPRCCAVADRDMLLQAVLNLLGNALNYTAGGGRVTVRLHEAPRVGAVEVSISDTGVGIPASDVPFVFDKFYRVPEHKQLAKGTGLGLNLVKHVVETMHGGKLSVASKPGVGSTFTFRLSMADKGSKVGTSPLAGSPVALASPEAVQSCPSGEMAGKDEQ
ncbi:MAG: ATP-binding protein [Phycisphaeraceae bacterium]